MATLSNLRRLLPALFLAIAGSALAGPIRFAPLPMEQPEEVVKQFKPMLAHLEKQLGERIEIVYSSSYADILEKFRRGEIDLAYLGPLPYVSLRKNTPHAVPVVHFLEKSGQPTYTCALISAGAALPKKVRDQRFALTQPLSTCGYLSTDDLLRKQGSSLEANRYRYLGKHDEVAQAVARGDFEFGGLKTSIAKSHAHLGIRILAETAPLPSFALIANGKQMTGAQIDLLRRVLTTADAATMKDWGNNIQHGSVAANDKDYDLVRRMHTGASIPEQNKP